MQANRRQWIGMLCGVVMLGGVTPAVFGQDFAGNGERHGTVIVTPRRPTLVQVCFDILLLRPAVLVCYEVVSHKPDPVLHVWDSTAREWRQMSLTHYQTGNFLAFRPKRTILLGLDSDLPASMADVASWGGTISRISQLSVADMMNEFDRDLSFASDEWRWLARRYGLTLRDLNSTRRKHGRYGPIQGAGEQELSIETWEPPPAVMTRADEARPGGRKPGRATYEEAIAPAVVNSRDDRLLTQPTSEDDELLRSLKAPKPIEQDITP